MRLRAEDPAVVFQEPTAVDGRQIISGLKNLPERPAVVVKEFQAQPQRAEQLFMWL